MERKIKFRVWDRKEQEMIYNALEITNFGLGDGSLLVDVKAQRGNELDWMQFTGLKDRLDREIYEGDILQSYDRKSDKLEVRFQNASFGIYDLDCPANGFGAFGSHFDLREWEVIGNIYEMGERE